MVEPADSNKTGPYPSAEKGKEGHAGLWQEEGSHQAEVRLAMSCWNEVIDTWGLGLLYLCETFHDKNVKNINLTSSKK